MQFNGITLITGEVSYALHIELIVVLLEFNFNNYHFHRHRRLPASLPDRFLSLAEFYSTKPNHCCWTCNDLGILKLRFQVGPS